MLVYLASLRILERGAINLNTHFLLYFRPYLKECRRSDEFVRSFLVVVIPLKNFSLIWKYHHNRRGITLIDLNGLVLGSVISQCLRCYLIQHTVTHFRNGFRDSNFKFKADLKQIFRLNNCLKKMFTCLDILHSLSITV